MKTKNLHNAPLICVFDSGIGGLNLLKACQDKLPFCNFVYVADNYNVPYGNLPEEKILKLVNKKFCVINSLNPAAAVIACNTATAVCVQYLRNKYSFPIIGIQPPIKQAVKNGGSIAVFATQATVKSSSFSELLRLCGNDKTKVYPLKDLAQKIEKNVLRLDKLNVPDLFPQIEEDNIVLGCTHYSYVKNKLELFYKKPIFDGIVGTVDHLRSFLGNFDHTPLKKQNLTFICGNFAKNRLIYSTLFEN
ncbi:MAG: aspartate/glutamate racemase family protein [Clostridia bacterium]|nr:aspartate/glutamate racemase family protein [Clostridia bacterium]